MTPQQRSREYLKKQGYEVATVEQWITFPERKNNVPTGKMIRTRRDCFGFADILGCHREHGAVLVQTTTRANQAARIAKIHECPTLDVVLLSGLRVEVHGWALAGARGERKTWQVTVTEIGHGGFALGAHARPEKEAAVKAAMNDTLFDYQTPEYPPKG